MSRDLLVSLAMHRLLLNTVPPVSVPLLRFSDFCWMLRGFSASTLPVASRASGFDSACIRPRPSWTFGSNSLGSLDPFSSTFSLSSGTSAHASLSRCSVTMDCFGILSNTSSACYWSCSFSRVLGSQPLAVSLSSRPFGTCFIQHSAHSLDVSSFHRLILQNHCCCSIHGTSSILTSRASGTHKPLKR